MTISEIIEALGGREAAAEVCGITADAVRKWEINGVPSKHWARIVDRTNGRVTFEALAVCSPKVAA